MKAFPKSAAEKRLKEFCKRFDVEQGEDFYGFTVGRRRVLYRHGSSYSIATKNGPHWRWEWKNPLGNKDRCTHVALHARESGPADEAIFLFTYEELQKIVRKWPQLKSVISVPSNPEAGPREARQAVLDNHMTMEQFGRWLKK